MKIITLNNRNKKKLVFPLILAGSFSLMSFLVYKDYGNLLVSENTFVTPANLQPKKSAAAYTVSSVVTAAQAFKALLTTTQIATLQHTYTATLGRKWSNLPCGSGCRNGIQFSTLTAAQLTAAKAVVQEALGSADNQGYNVFNQILLADDYLNANGGGSGYGAGLYFISFLNEPSATGAWMLQVGGHHMAFNISFNNGNVVGTTPVMLGVEPKTFTTGGVTYNPLANKHDAMTAMLASLTTAQLSAAHLTQTFSDCLMSPGESNNNTNTMPAVKQGVICSGFSTAQKNLVIAAIQTWTADMDSETAAAIQAVYEGDIDNTYVAYTGSGTSGSSSTFLTANTNYVRIDGPSAWIEFVCQSGVVFQSQIHYHSVWRDHVRDYGADLTATTLGTTQMVSNNVQSIKLYPNPSTETLTIETATALAGASIELYDAVGRFITSVKNASGTTVNIPVANLAAGNYIVWIEQGKQVSTAKFIKN